MSQNYKKKILSLINQLPQIAPNNYLRKNKDNLLQALKDKFKNNVLTHQVSGGHEIYMLQAPFSIVMINFKHDTSYLFTYLDHNTTINAAVDFNHLSCLHKHEYFELLYILDGQLNMEIEGKCYRYNKGDACLINQNIRHIEKYQGSYIAIYFSISKNYLRELFSEKEFNDIKGNVTEFFRKNSSDTSTNESDYIDFFPTMNTSLKYIDETEKNIYYIIKELLSRNPGYKSIVRGNFLRFIHNLQMPSKYIQSHINLGHISDNKNLIEDVLVYINNKKRKITRRELSEVLHYNGDYINQVFEKYIKQSITEYTRNVCLKEATHLLINTDMSITRIIKQLGYVNRTTFYSQFKKRYGVTPQQYRQGNNSI